MKTHKWLKPGFDWSTACRPDEIYGHAPMLGAHNWGLVDCKKCLKTRNPIDIMADPRIPEGQVVMVDKSGKVVGKIVNVRTK